MMVTGVVTNAIQTQLRSTSSTASHAVHVLMSDSMSAVRPDPGPGGSECVPRPTVRSRCACRRARLD
ncbi:hypothetical protein C1N91_14990 [Curtobacterium sp. SGAir0471]|nr:hypothetical protein C1N91_14990 [Curtobacterium sp. SGAir0471]